MARRRPVKGRRKPARTEPRRGPAPAGAVAPRAAPADDPGEAPGSDRRAIGGDARRVGLENAVVVLVNEHRRRAGLVLLAPDERLRASARRHSADMAERRYFAHVAPDGGTPAGRMRAAGHPAPAAENLARGQRSPHEAVHAWWNSPGHRRNLLDPDVRTIGVGVHLAGSEGPWWTQHFGYS